MNVAGNEFSAAKDLTEKFSAEIGIVLGSGLGGLVESMDILESIPYAELPGMPISKVPGHTGRLSFARIGSRIVALAQGRVHLYENRSAREVTACVRLLDALGVTKLILTNAAGTVNPHFFPGSWMMICDHLNLTGTSPLLGGPNFFDMSGIYSARLRQHFSALAKAENISLHEGVYAGVIGPQYETPAEVRMLRQLGADAIGMSTVLEAIQARALGMEVAGFSCLTNWAAGIGTEPLSHQDVLAIGESSAAEGGRLLLGGLRALTF